MFNQLDTDDPELGTKMFLLVMRKYMSSGSAPSQNWSKEMRRKQGENETSEDVWDRIKVCAAALDSAGRPQSSLSMFDALKENLSSSHTHWVNTIADTWTLEEVDAAVFNHGQFVDNKKGRGDSKTNAAYPSVDSGDSRDLTIRELTACIARLEEQVNRMAAGTSGSGKGAARFTGECHYCRKPGHKISECKKLKEKNQASGKGSSGGESSSGGAAFPACLAAHFVDHVDGASDFSDDLDIASDCSDYDAAGAIVTAVLPVYNSFDLLGDLDELPDELVDELTSGESPSAENSVPATLPGLQSPPELDFDKTQKLDWVWDFISGQWVDPVKFPSILTHKVDPRSGLIYTSLFNLADYEDYENLAGYASWVDQYYSFFRNLGQESDDSDSEPTSPPPARRLSTKPVCTYRNATGPVEIQEFDLPACYQPVPDGGPIVPTGDCSPDEEITLHPEGISHHERRRLRRQARLERWVRRDASRPFFPAGGFYTSQSDASSSPAASSSGDTWVTDESADDHSVSVNPAFDRERLRLRHSALKRAGARRSRPRSYASFVRMANRVVWSARKRTYFRPTGEQSPSSFSTRVAGSIVTWTRRTPGSHKNIFAEAIAQCYAATGPSRGSSRGRRHRWLVDSGANNHMNTEESECTVNIVPSSGFITGVSVDIVGQGDCDIQVVTSSGQSLSATIHDVKITPDLSARTNGAFTRIFSVRQAVRNGCSVLFSPTVNSLSLPDGTVIPLVTDNGLYWLEFEFPADAAETPVAWGC